MNLPIWIYWEGECPEWIKLCRETIYAHGEDVRLITPKKFDELRTEDRDIDLSHLYVAHRADFIRAYLLAKFGGLYIDSDCIVMKSLSPLFNKLDNYDFFAFTQRQGNISNSFIGAKKNSIIANNFYQRICNILRSKKQIEWLTIGSEALEASIKEVNIPWYKIDVEQVQPICWSTPLEFFNIRNYEEHNASFNPMSYCYMLSGSMTAGVLRDNPYLDLLNKKSFFSFLIEKTKKQKKQEIASALICRKNTDDDRWVIPELIIEDMYQISSTLSRLSPNESSIILDCGAHIGVFSVMCAEFLHNTDIFSFEPSTENFSLLEENVKNYKNIEPINAAISTKNELLYLVPPTGIDMTGRWITSRNDAQNTIPIKAIDLVAFIRSLDKPVYILKLDLEGYESFIINNFPSDLYNKIKIIILETHDEKLNHRLLSHNGFKILFRPHISSDRQFVYIKEI